MALLKRERLKKQLTLFDVYVIAAGAMFSSGFFLLPSLAAAKAGPAVVLAYLISALLTVPALVSKAELATAMPRAGGTYYFLDRTMGPLVGTIGGMGTWLTLVLKSAFALIGMGAYLGLFFDVPLKPLAIILTLAFAALNMLGAKQSSGLLRVLVSTLLAVLAVFAFYGLVEVFIGVGELRPTSVTPFMPHGVDGLLATVGLVFVSYVGMTKVASVAEEVTNPDRNIPLGMTLALMTSIIIYGVGVFVMVAVLGPDRLSASLTPVADTAERLFVWMPDGVGVVIIVVAAIAAFASAANAGMLAASRYPLAMARDRLIPTLFKWVGRLRTPVPSILVTAAVMITFLIVLDVEEVAKLASALQLAIFALVNVAVIVMRESRIEAYDPGFRSPLYPWMQLVGIVSPIVLVAEMGWFPALFTMGVVALSFAWYTYYAQGHLAREGAIFHVFERLGRRRFTGLDRELREMMKEKGLRAEDPFDVVVARAQVIDCAASVSLNEIIQEAADQLSTRVPATAARLAADLSRGTQMGGTPVSHGAALLHTRLPEFDGSEMVVVRCKAGARIDTGDESLARQASQSPIRAIFILVSGESDPGRHLRILAQLAGRVDDDDFMEAWLADRDEQELKETLLRDDRFLSLRLDRDTEAAELIGRRLQELEMPEGSLVAMIRRAEQLIIPRGGTVLLEGDRLTVIGEPLSLRAWEQRYGGNARS